MSPDDIIAAARECIGTRFRHQGRICGRALDCAGVVVHVVRKLGLDYEDVPAYGLVPFNGLLEKALDAQPCLERVESAQAGDILLMRFLGEPQHLAVFTGTSIVHAYLAIGKVCEHDLDDDWRSRIIRIYRIVGIA